MKNRIHIVNWRMHGDDEDYIYFAVYGADDARYAEHEIQQQVDPDYDWDNEEGPDPEDEEDWDHVYYINDDITIEDGQIFEHNGRKFRVTIQEIS